MSFPPYDYQPLPRNDCIRLLYLMPGELGDPLVVHLLSVPLTESPPFEALSYVWGDPLETVAIPCGTRGGFVSIRTSLRDALDYLRHPDEIKKLWVDALCINQTNVQERNQQVQMMAQIYWHATQVVVWLGLDNDPKAPASVVYGVIENTVLYAWSLHEKYGSADNVPQLASLADLPLYDQSKWEQVATFFTTRPYFRRGWVVQELGLAYNARMLCGREYIDLSVYFPFVRWIMTKGIILLREFNFDLESQFLSSEYWLSTRHSEGIAHMSFIAVLRETGTIECTQPHDYIYAFLGHPSAYEAFSGDEEPFEDYNSALTAQKFKAIVVPDYTKPAEEAFTELAQNLLLHYDDLWILSFVCHNKRTFSDSFASWAPRWNIYKSHNTLGTSFFYDATLGSRPVVQFEQSKLILLGHQIDEISWKYSFTMDQAPTLKGKDSSWSNSHETITLETIWMKYRHYLRTFREQINPDREALYYTLTAGLLDGHPAEDPKFAPQFSRNVSAYILERLKNSNSTNTQRLQDLTIKAADGDAQRFFLDMEAMQRHHILVCTKNGRLGLAHCGVEVGDRVFLFAGATVPFILREMDTGCYRMVGESYIHGVMRGEAFEEMELDEVIIC